MNIVIHAEEKPETRVALTPSVIKPYQQLGFNILLTRGAGLYAGFSDVQYQSFGIESGKARAMITKADILLCVNPPAKRTLKILPENSIVICQLDDRDEDMIDYCQNHSLSVINMNRIPRISRAQSMDTLSSQANLAGYKAVLLAVNLYQRMVPMMMTAAGMIHPAKVLILGAGVAGLQAIATAKRLGAAVFAFDVRKAAKEQVESLGAEFVEVSDDDMEGEGGYASETSDEYRAMQAKLIHEHASDSDIIITTALIPNRPAPILLSEETIQAMKPGSVVVDMATSRGGNCALSTKDKIIEHNGVNIIGYSNLAGMLPATASELYAYNLLQLVKLLLQKDQTIQFNSDDVVIQNALICHQGTLSPYLKEVTPS